MNYYTDMTEKQDIFTIMGGRVKMLRGEYNATSDAVWLASFISGDFKTVLDVGTGTGAVALCIMARHPGVEMTVLDISEDMLNECRQNFELNGRTAEFVAADILSWRPPRTFELVVSNPPYFKGTPAKHNAHHNTDLNMWVRRCVARVKPRGVFATIVDAASAGIVLGEIARHCGDIKLVPLFSNQSTAERVLISGRLDSRSGSKIYAALNMNSSAILRDGLTISEYLSKLSGQ